MVWLRILILVLAIAAIGCGLYTVHLHLITAPRPQLRDAQMLTILFGLLSTALAALQTRIARK